MATIPAAFTDRSRLLLARIVHELSIALRIVELSCEHVASCPDAQVESIHVAIGALTQVHESSLRFGFGVASEGTAVQGSRLEVRIVPIEIHCRACHSECQTTSLLDMHCPTCQSEDTEIRSGNELELEFITLKPSSPSD